MEKRKKEGINEGAMDKLSNQCAYSSCSRGMYIYAMRVKGGERKERGREREKEGGRKREREEEGGRKRERGGREGGRSTHQHGLSERLACQALELAVL